MAPRLVWLLALATTARTLAGSDGAPTGQAQALIEHFHMTQIPDEGPWFAVSYVSDDQLAGAALPARYGGRTHAAGSAIYAVETRRDFSAVHRLQTDETWHFYGGDPIEMLLLYPDGHGETIVLGADVLKGERPQFTVPRGVWQGSSPMNKADGAYSFFADQLAPAFDYADFEMGYRDELQKAYPRFSEKIAELTRPAFKARATNTWEKVAPIPVSPGVTLRELVGRVAAEKSNAYSVAHFVVDAGKSTALSHNKTAEETFLVISGHGHVALGDKTELVGPGSTVAVPPGVSHSLAANPSEKVEFYAISAPAFTPEDYVLDSAK